MKFEEWNSMPIRVMVPVMLRLHMQADELAKAASQDPASKRDGREAAAERIAHEGTVFHQVQRVNATPQRVTKGTTKRAVDERFLVLLALIPLETPNPNPC